MDRGIVTLVFLIVGHARRSFLLPHPDLPTGPSLAHNSAGFVLLGLEARERGKWFGDFVVRVTHPGVCSRHAFPQLTWQPLVPVPWAPKAFSPGEVTRKLLIEPHCLSPDPIELLSRNIHLPSIFGLQTTATCRRTALGKGTWLASPEPTPWIRCPSKGWLSAAPRTWCRSPAKGFPKIWARGLGGMHGPKAPWWMIG